MRLFCQHNYGEDLKRKWVSKELTQTKHHARNLGINCPLLKLWPLAKKNLFFGTMI